MLGWIGFVDVELCWVVSCEVMLGYVGLC